jgi:hypothetical protein
LTISLTTYQIQVASAATYTEVFTDGILNTSVVITQNSSNVVKNLSGGDGVEAQYHNRYQGNYGLGGHYLNLHQITTDVVITFPSNAKPTSFTFTASIVNGVQPSSYTYDDGTTVNFNVPDTVNGYAGYFTNLTVTGDGRLISSFTILGGVSRDYWAIDNLTWSAASPTQSSTVLTGFPNAVFNTNQAIVATVDTAGRITFYADNKRIPKCISLPITSTVTCNWKPKIHKAFQISAKLQPASGSYLASTSLPLMIKVAPRTNTR